MDELPYFTISDPTIHDLTMHDSCIFFPFFICHKQTDGEGTGYMALKSQQISQDNLYRVWYLPLKIKIK